MATRDQAPTSPATTGNLSSNALGARHVIFLVIAAAAPLGFAVGAIPLAIGRGGVGTAGMFLVTGIILLVFAIGYVAMAKHVRRAGGLYLFVSEGLGRTLGVGSAFVITLGYAIAATAAVGVFALLMQSLVTELFATSTPWIAWALLAAVLMGVLGILKVELNARVLGIILLLEVGILLVVGIAVIVQGGAMGLTPTAFNPSEIFAGNPGAMLAITIVAFSGFEATVLFVEEVRKPDRSIARATYGAILVMVAIYAFATWTLIQAFGDQGAVDQAANDPINMYFTAAGTFAGEWAVALMGLLVVTSWFASILAFHNATSRYLLAMGRDRAMPRVLSRVHPRFGSPWVASASHTAFTLIVVVAFFLVGADPYLDLYVLGSVPAVIAIPFMELLASIAIIGYFARDRRGMSTMRVIVAPAIAAVALAVVTVLVITQIDVFTGRGGLVNGLLVGFVGLALLVGVLRATWLKARRPEVYQGLGSSNPFDANLPAS